MSKMKMRGNHVFDCYLNENIPWRIWTKWKCNLIEDEKEYANQQITDENSMYRLSSNVQCTKSMNGTICRLQLVSESQSRGRISWHHRFSVSESSREMVSVFGTYTERESHCTEWRHRLLYSETICHNKIPFKNYQIIKYHILYLRPTLCPQTIETTVTIQYVMRFGLEHFIYFKIFVFHREDPHFEH